MPAKSRFLTCLFPRLTVFLSLFLGGSGNLWAAEELPMYAEEVFSVGPFPITNSMVMVWLLVIGITLVVQLATRKMALVPRGLQNFVEWMVESLVGFFAGIMGEGLARRTFWFIGTAFILILFANWAGLIPGVGTVGWELSGNDVDPNDTWRPFLRGANADLNLTLAMAGTFFVVWFYWCLTEIGLKNFAAHIFAPKGKFKGAMLVMMIAIFGIVGLIEVLSIAVRPIALTFRLYGNIYAGENMLETLMYMVPEPLMFLPVIPFYFFELMVGFVQALVFALLCAVFTKLMCEHHDDHEHEDAEGDEQNAGHTAEYRDAQSPSSS